MSIEASTHGGGPSYDDVERALADIAAGRPVVVVDDAERENEGDLIFAASKATPELLAFMVRHTSGVICVPMEGDALDRLELPLMTPRNTERMRTAYTVSVDAGAGITTGISAADRATTIRALADSATEARDLTRPGHIFPLRYTEGGVLRRPGHTEAAVDLARLAGLTPAGVIAEVVNDDGTMARAPRLRRFADEHGLAMISIAELIDFRRGREAMVRRVGEAELPTRHGAWRAVGYAGELDGAEHIALVYEGTGDGSADSDTSDAGAAPGDRNPLVRVHSECLTGDVLGSLRCDCGSQLEQSMDAIAREGHGVVIYLRGHEGRGIGLLHKLRAYELQDGGADTVDANLELGLPADARDYAVAAQILADLGVTSPRLLTNNPAKVDGLARWGVRVSERVALPVAVSPHNTRYLRTKRDRMGHDIPGLPATDVPGSVRTLSASADAGDSGDAGDDVPAGDARVRRFTAPPTKAYDSEHEGQEGRAS